MYLKIKNLFLYKKIIVYLFTFFKFFNKSLKNKTIFLTDIII